VAVSSDIKPSSGLSEAEVALRLKKEGYNELPSSKGRTAWTIALEVVREPMFLLLLASGAIYLILGDRREAMMLLGFVFLVMGLTIYEERKTERALEALRDLSSPRARVIREGVEKRIAGREVVPGDLLVLSEGDRVPADAVLLRCSNFSVDESLLTGESVPVRKVPCEIPGAIEPPGGEDRPFVFSGTLVVKGQGLAIVSATGLKTEIGKIGKALESVESKETPLQKEIRQMVGRLAVLGFFLCLLVVVTYGLTRGSWMGGVLAGITLAMALLPEEFPVVLTIFLALGAWRISKKRVLTRRVPAVETLGSATVLCVDKTGTLTLNQMAVSRLSAKGEICLVDQSSEAIPESFHELLEFAILAMQKVTSDPMEKALRRLGIQSPSFVDHLHDDYNLLQEYPLSSDLLAMSLVWKSPEGADGVIAAKGAPEAIADLCHLSEAEKLTLNQEIGAMAENGLRVLGIAKGITGHHGFYSLSNLPEEQHDILFEFLGLIGLSDPVRPTVPEAIQECYSAGIRVVMITGDYPGTARHIAQEIGLKGIDRVITGPELDLLDDRTLQDRIRQVSIFARVVPDQKLRIVNALKANGDIVAMTGDGVNDAPALKSAHIGIAMGGRGTDVAREAADLVLLDDDFSSIVQAVKLGRRIFDNLKKAMAYIVAIHIPIAGMSLIPVLFKWPLVFLPVHIVFLEMIIDPACSVVFEAEGEEAGLMSRPPRNPQEPLLGWKTLSLSFLQGFSVLIIVAGVFFIALRLGHEELDARALTFTTLIVANLGLILTNRSWSRTILSTLRSPNKALWWVLGSTILFLGLVLYVPFLRTLFHFSRLHLNDLILCLSAGLVSILWFEGLKAVNGRRIDR
jgi:P-type Ca2+ transporter type 2C